VLALAVTTAASLFWPTPKPPAPAGQGLTQADKLNAPR
jgi:hypothetical protein